MGRYTAKRVIKEIGIPHLTELVCGDGYWYFVWDNRLWESHSVYIQRLCDLPIERWVDEGRQFAERMKEEESFMAEYEPREVIKIA